MTLAGLVFVMSSAIALTLMLYCEQGDNASEIKILIDYVLKSKSGFIPKSTE